MSGSKWAIATAVAAGILLATANAGQAQTPANTSADPSPLFGSISVLSTQRSQPGGGIIVGDNPFTGASFSTGRDFDYGRATNIDATIGVRFWRTEAIELRFMNFDNNSSHSFRTPGGFIGAGFTGPGNTLFEGQAQTKMESWEVNWRHQMFDQLSVLVGYREIHLGDNLHYAINSTVAFGEYDYSNKLRGVQIGVEWALLPRANPLQVNLSGKIGRYDTGISGGISEFQGSNHTFIGSFVGSSSQYAWGSEAGVMVGYRLSDTVMVRAGYQALWLNDVGLASNAAARSLLNPSLLRTVGRDDIVFQSINVGLAIGY
jgi:hypothetical protein